MRVAIAGAGNVGRSIAGELQENGHDVLLIDRSASAIKPDSAPGAQWVLADACELSSLSEAGLQSYDIVIAATGDDKVNLVVALLAKTEFAVPRVVARVNHPKNEWLFTEAWGVDVAVSKPRIMAALVEEAVTVGDVVRLFSFRQGQANLVEVTLPASSPAIGVRVSDIPWPTDTALVGVVRGQRVLVPRGATPLEAGDELLFVTQIEHEDELKKMLCTSTGAQWLESGQGSSE